MFLKLPLLPLFIKLAWCWTRNHTSNWNYNLPIVFYRICENHCVYCLLGTVVRKSLETASWYEIKLFFECVLEHLLYVETSLCTRTAFTFDDADHEERDKILTPNTAELDSWLNTFLIMSWQQILGCEVWLWELFLEAEQISNSFIFLPEF